MSVEIATNINTNDAAMLNDKLRFIDELIYFHALKLSPQEQLVAALGFFTLKPPSCKAST